MGKHRVKKRQRLTIYGTSWCPQSGATRRLLDREGVRYRYIDIDDNPAAAKHVMSLTGGNRSVPTIVLPDERALIEPSTRELRSVLGLAQPRRWWWPF